MSKHPDTSELHARALLPEVMFPEDVAVALNVARSSAIDLMRLGRLGVVFDVSGRPAVLRQDFLAALRRLGSGEQKLDLMLDVARARKRGSGGRTPLEQARCSSQDGTVPAGNHQDGGEGERQ